MKWFILRALYQIIHGFPFHSRFSVYYAFMGSLFLYKTLPRALPTIHLAEKQAKSNPKDEPVKFAHIFPGDGESYS